MADESTLDDFLQAALTRGHLDEGQAADLRRIAAVLAEIALEVSPADIAVRKGFLTEATARDVQRAAARRRIGRYEVLERIGTGAMGVVWRARDTKLDRVVALKVLAREALQRQAVRERFLREGRTAMRLNHTNIVRGLEFGEAAGYTFLALEYVPGETLMQVLERRGSLSESEALGIAIEVTKALEHLQEFKLVHRDIKPDNLILSTDGPVKLCDLGLTRPALLEAHELGVEEEAIGTPTYVSPEQIQRPDHIDWRADMYSLGCTLYHALTGSPPFTAKSAVELTRMQVDTAPRDPREHDLDLSEGTATLVLKMLHKDPAKRYASLEDLRADLRSVLEGGPAVHALSAAPVKPKTAVAIGDVHRTARAGRLPRRRRGKALPLIGAAVLVLVAVGVGMALLDRGSLPAEPGDGNGGTAQVPGPDDQAPAGGAGAEKQPKAPVAPIRSRHESDAEHALGVVRAYIAENPDDFLEIGKRLDFVTERFAGTGGAKDAAALREWVQTRRETAAEKLLGEIRTAAEPLERAGRLHAAWERFQAFPLTLDDTPAAEEARTQAERIADAARSVLGEVETGLPGALAEQRFEDARGLVERLDGAGLPDFAPRIATLRSQLASALTGFETLRAEQQPRFDALYARALADAAAGDLEGARRRIESDGPALGTYRAELARVAPDLEAVTRVRSAAERAWNANTGKAVEVRLRLRGTKPVKGRNGGFSAGRFVIETASGTLRLRSEQLAATELVALARSELVAGDSADQVGLLIFELGCGDLPGAREQLEVLRLAGGPAAEAEGRVLRVERSLLAEVADLTRRAEIARLQKRLGEARDLLGTALERLPGHAPSLFALGRLLVQDGRGKQAVPILEEARAAPESAAAVDLWLGRALAGDGELESAQTALRAFLAQARADDPLRVEAERDLAAVTLELTTTVVKKLRREADRLVRRKRWGEAEAVLERVLQLKPGDATAAFQLGLSYARQNKLFPAIRTLTRFTEDHPRNSKVAEAHRELAAMERYHSVNREDREKTAAATAALRAGRAREALEQFESALLWSPLYEPAHRGRVQAWRKVWEKEGTQEAARGLVGALDDLAFVIGPNAEILIARARANGTLGEHRAAAEDAERAMALDKRFAEPALVAGHARLALGELDAATSHFEEASRREASADALYGLGLVNERDGYLQDAFDLFTRALRDMEPSVAIRRQLEEALQRVRKALDSEVK